LPVHGPGRIYEDGFTNFAPATRNISNADVWLTSIASQTSGILTLFREAELTSCNSRATTATRAPVGYLLLEHPPEEPLPIPDYRTMGDQRIERPSPDLLDTIFICQQRQDWYRDFARAIGDEPLSFVGEFSVDTPVEEAASTMTGARSSTPRRALACPHR
jgi:hypothetical protein